MARRIQALTGTTNVVLPNGWALNGGDEVVVSDDMWNTILADDNLSILIVDLGTTTDAADVAPTWRDIQRAVTSGISGGGGTGGGPGPSDGAVPPAPTGVGASSGIGDVFVRWTAVTNADPILAYRVYANNEVVAETLGTTVIVARLADDSPLPYDTDTSFYVTAVDQDGESLPSMTVTHRPAQIQTDDINDYAVVVKKFGNTAHYIY